MHEIWEALKTVIDPETVLREGGFYLLLFIVFAETGLFFGFFLPGDYLLFLAGLFCAGGMLNVDIVTLSSGIAIAGILGNYVGYWFGYRTGPLLFKRDDSWLFKKKYMVMAEEFYRKYGGAAIVLGRFFPIIRTFAPIFAGVVKVDLKRFSLYNISGSFLWVATLTLSGYFLGKQFPQLHNYIEYIIIGLIVVTAAPLVTAYLKRRIRLNKTRADEVEGMN